MANNMATVTRSACFHYEKYTETGKFGAICTTHQHETTHPFVQQADLTGVNSSDILFHWRRIVLEINLMKTLRIFLNPRSFS
jgi:hypothetical protein